jgi:hypothetical protein
MHTKLFAFVIVDVSAVDQRLIMCSAFVEKRWEHNGTVYQLFTNFKEACESVCTYNILIKFGTATC